MTDTTEPPLEAWMLAVESRDARFDGWVIVGVTSTRIYCRPSCPTPVRPKRANMVFFPTPASAQSAGFRACKRCAPDASPGSPEWNRRDDLVARAIRAIEDGVVDREGVEGLAARLHVSQRHLGRLFGAELGASPLALARARRARSARILIETTDLPFTDVAFAAGFDSVRQFNDTIRLVFASSPTELRQRSRAGARRPRVAVEHAGWISLRLGCRRPFDVGQVWQWLASHAVAGVEEIDGPRYRRSLRLPSGSGVVELEPGDHGVEARFRLDDFGDLPAAVQACRRLLDLDADPAVIASHLGADPVIGPLITAEPGLRSPGDASGVDATIRAVLHQQVSTASARAIGSRLVARLGEPLAEPVGSVTTVMPAAEVWAAADPEMLGMPRARAATLVAVAQRLADGRIDVSPLADRAETMARLCEVKGIGQWTASVVALRGMADPDVWCSSDLALKRVAAEFGIGADLDAVAQHWRPWRSYAMHHLWRCYPVAAGSGAARTVAARNGIACLRAAEERS